MLKRVVTGRDREQGVRVGYLMGSGYDHARLCSVWGYLMSTLFFNRNKVLGDVIDRSNHFSMFLRS